MIRIVEVGPRDGLQNEHRIIPTDTKVALIDALSKTGVDEIEASAFVAPKWIPQLTDAQSVFARITRNPNVTYSALVPNQKGMERALEAKVDKIAVFTAASESFTQHNINASIAESLRRFKPVIAMAKQEKLPVRGYISTAFWCPYAGKIAPEKSLEVARQLIELGVDELSIGDTIGKAVPDEVKALLNLFLKEISSEHLAMHFHDTYHHAVENVKVSYELGIETFDSSVSGIGGCPYAPSTTGNIGTGELVQTLREKGAEVKIDGAALSDAATMVTTALSS